MNNKRTRFILLIVILVCVVTILLFGIIIFNEINSSKKECGKINGTYSLKNFNHFCNNVSFYKYSDGEWGYGRGTLNLSELNLTELLK